jgi:hypothetical protein
MVRAKTAVDSLHDVTRNSLSAALPPTLAKTAQGWGTPSWNGANKKHEGVAPVQRIR